MALTQTAQPITLSDISFSATDVFNALTAHNTSKAMEIDGIGPKVLKCRAPALLEPLFHLFSLTLSEHCLPAQWGMHLIYSYT